MAQTQTAEKAAAYRVFDVQVMKDFLYNHAHDVVGENKAGKKTTLIEEIGEVARMTHRAYVQDGVNYYRSNSAYRNAELTEEQVIARSESMYKAAAKKLLFLNTVCKLIEGSHFIAQRINKDNLDDAIALVDAFEWCVRNYSEL